VKKLTEAMVAIDGENMRPVTVCCVQEVRSGDYGIGGNPLTTADVKNLAAGQPAAVCSAKRSRLSASPALRRPLGRSARGAAPSSDLEHGNAKTKIEGRKIMTTDVAQTAPSGTVHANGQDLYYEIHGDGPPLVLLMGIGYDSSLWTLAQVPALSTQFRVMLVDNRDAGRSSKATSSYEIADLADDLAGLLDALGIPRTHLLGLSMGGMIAQEFALRHPDRLDRLVLAGTGAAPARSAVDPIQIWTWVKANDATGDVFGGQQFVSLFSAAFLRNHPAVQDTAELLASNPYPMSPEAYGRQAAAYLRFDALDRLAAITAPTLVVVGEQDLLTPPWIVRELADAIPDARFEVIRGDGSSHVMPIERADDFNRLVSDFLSG
jgi:3-oxoadipate enol-lactonase